VQRGGFSPHRTALWNHRDRTEPNPDLKNAKRAHVGSPGANPAAQWTWRRAGPGTAPHAMTVHGLRTRSTSCASFRC